MQSVEQELTGAFGFARKWALENKIPLTMADFVVLKRIYIPAELERHRADPSTKHSYRFAAIFALRNLGFDFNMDKTYIQRCTP